jgi:hypothetical protein
MSRAATITAPYDPYFIVDIVCERGALSAVQGSPA